LRHDDISTVPELFATSGKCTALSPLFTRGVRLKQDLRAGAAVRSAPTRRIIALVSKRVEEASVVLGRDATVRRPPTPLQRAQRALKVIRDLEAHPVCACPRRQVPPLRVRLLDWLAVATAVAWYAVAWPRSPHQLLAVKASLRVCRGWADLLVAEAKLKVTHMVSSEDHDELHCAAGRQGSLWP